MPLIALPDEVTITSLRQRAVQADQSVVYEGDVRVVYGKSTLTADRIVAYGGTVMRVIGGKPTPNREIVRGVAEGHVVLRDPAGTVLADRIELGFDPNNSYQRGENVSVRIENGLLKARRAEFYPDRYELFDVEGTTAPGARPLYLVSSDHITVDPRKQAVIHQPRVVLLGRTLGKLPTQRVSLVQAVQGFHYPTLAYKEGRGFGLSASGGVATGKQSVFSYNTRIFQSRNVQAFSQYTRSFQPLENSTQVVAPLTDFAERFVYGFLNTSGVDSPDAEASYLRARKSSLSFGGQYNGGVVDRDRGTRYSKIESIYENGGPWGDMGYLTQIRVQGIKREEDGMDPRVKLIGALSPQVFRLTPRVSFFNRLNSEAFLGDTAYGWAQATSGLAFGAFPWLRLSAGGYLSGDVGQPQFRMDELYAKAGLIGRADLKVGGLTLTYLLKQDVRRGLYDHEFAFRQIAGPVELFYEVRQFPRNRALGLVLRVEPFVSGLKRRVAEVTGKPLPEASSRNSP